MSWQPHSGVDTARARAAMKRDTRQFFAERDVLEVSTPALAATGVTDPNIDSVPVMLGDQALFLHSSPEYMMKRLIAGGYPDVFQICRVFRGAEAGRRHLPEFTMIEWYRLGFDLQAIITDCVDLITRLLSSKTLQQPRIASYADLFTECLSLDPLTASTADIVNALDADEQLRGSVGEDREAWLDLAMATRIAPSFDDDCLTVIYHYPASQAALARRCPADDAVADRFEVCLGALELANGFVELTDPDEQLARFEQERRIRAGRDQPDIAVDERLVAALRAGMPECAGVALGLDRLLMIAEGRDDIIGTLTFVPGDIVGR